MEQQNISSDLIRGHIDTIILHTLLRGDKFAQQISDSVEQKSDKEYKINQATLYSSLKRLESLKLVQSYWNDSESGRRKYFKLTQNGKETVESNLSNWSYSRSVIDKLMDCASKPVIRTQYVERIIEVPKEISKEASPINTSANNNEINDSAQIKESDLNNQVKSNDNSSESVQEINFRNILNGLIKSTTVQRVPTVEPLNPLNKSDVVEEKPVVVQKFNETIASTDYNAERNNNGKIDFGDLTLKAVKEGYKLRISSKDSCIAKGTILINKLNFLSSFITAVFAIISILIIGLALLKDSPIRNSAIIFSAIALMIYPLFTAIKYLLSPKHTTAKRISADAILTSAIVVFDLILITVAINLLINVDFSNISTIAVSMVLPIVIFIFVIVFFAIKFLLSKNKIFKLNTKQMKVKK